MKPPGTVICAALNFRGAVDSLVSQFRSDPYKSPPNAPILYHKPPNTYNADGGDIVCPMGIGQLRMGGSVGLIMARNVCRADVDTALGYVAGVVVVNDVSIPHSSYYRPAIRERCRDGFLPIGPFTAQVSELDSLPIQVFVNGKLAAENSTANLVRPVRKLLADVTEFMTLADGDLLVVGEPDNAPLASLGDTVRVEVPGVGAIENRIVPERS